MHMRPHGGPAHGNMKCFVCKESCFNSPWDLEHVAKVCRNHSYVTTRKTMITSPQVLDVSPSFSSNWFSFYYLSCSKCY